MRSFSGVRKRIPVGVSGGEVSFFLSKSSCSFFFILVIDDVSGFGLNQLRMR